MYQPCTSTAVNHGEQRGLHVEPQPAPTRQNTRPPGAPETATISLITRRSQVQILPPPPSTRSEALSARRKGPLPFCAQRGRTDGHDWLMLEALRADTCCSPVSAGSTCGVAEMVTANEPMGNSAKDHVLFALLRENPAALVSAIGSDGLFVDLPGSVTLTGQQLVHAKSALDLVQPGSKTAIVSAWERARMVGVSSASVVLVDGTAASYHFVDVRHSHGVFIGVITSDGRGELAHALAGHAPVMPKTGRIDKNEVALILSADDRICRILGFQPAEMVGRRSLDFIHPDEQNAAIEAWMEMLSAPGDSTRLRARHQRHDGSWVWMEFTNTNQLADPEPRVVTEMLDISDEMAALETVRQHAQLLGRLAEALPSGVLHVDRGGNVVYANRRLHDVIGIGISAKIEDQFATVIMDDRPSLIEAIRCALDDGLDGDIEVKFRRPGAAALRACAIAIRVLTDSNGSPTGAILCVDDVTDASELRAGLERRATIDELTGCLNRAAVIAALDQVLLVADAGSPGCAVVFLDLDGFKEVNDTFGHDAGDQLLAGAASRLRSAVRGADLVGRLGGDEFIIVIPRVDSLDAAMERAHELSRSLNHPFKIFDGLPVRIKASIGVAWTRTANTTADALIAAADMTMYQSKRTGVCTPMSTTI